MYQNIWNTKDSWEKTVLKEKSIPQLWVYGDEDKYTNISEVEFASNHPALELLVLKDFHHGVMRESSWKRRKDLLRKIDVYLD
jgi:pimeloyl-ACP methyl ester carboxylesterase